MLISDPFKSKDLLLGEWLRRVSLKKISLSFRAQYQTPNTQNQLISKSNVERLSLIFPTHSVWIQYRIMKSKFVFHTSIVLLSLLGLNDSIYGKDHLPSDTVRHEVNTTFSISGYAKYLQSTLFVHDGFAGVPSNLLDQFLGNSIHDHLIHLRLNSTLQVGQFVFHAGWRVRTFYGDQPRLYRLIGADYGKEIDRYANDQADLSDLWFNKKGWVVHSVFDRAYVAWQGKQDEIRVGRQRINWGRASLWNPNDVFNAYSFIDFDYEERPGTDAIRWTHTLGNFNSFEIAARVTDSLEGCTFAALYKGYLKSVNYQVLTGYVQNDLALGGGWEADLGMWGWKGEGTVFIPLENEDGLNTALSLSTDFSRTWESGFLVGGGYLLNTSATGESSLFADLNERVNARNLYPYRHSLFVQIGYPMTPLFNTNLAVVYSPSKENTLFISPVLSYSLASNWDVDLTGQIIAQDNGKAFISPLQAFFLRLRWSI